MTSAVRSRLIFAGVALVAAVLVAGPRGRPSSRPPIHLNPNMDYQEKLQPLEESRFFPDGSAMRVPVPGTVARGQLREDAGFFTGKDAAGEFLATMPVEPSDQLLRAFFRPALRPPFRQDRRV